MYPSVPVVNRARPVPTGSHITAPAAQAAVVYGCVSVSTQLDPWASGAVEIATRNVIAPGSVGLAQAHLLTKPPGMRKRNSLRRGPGMVGPPYPFGRWSSDEGYYYQ